MTEQETIDKINATIADINEATVPGCRYIVNHHLKVLVGLIKELVKKK